MYCKYVASFDLMRVTVGNTDMQSVELRRVLLLLCFVNEGPQMVVPASIWEVARQQPLPAGQLDQHTRLPLTSHPTLSLETQELPAVCTKLRRLVYTLRVVEAMRTPCCPARLWRRRLQHNGNCWENYYKSKTQKPFLVWDEDFLGWYMSKWVLGDI